MTDDGSGKSTTLAALLDKINQTGDYNGEIQDGLKSGLEKFKATQSW